MASSREEGGLYGRGGRNRSVAKRVGQGREGHVSEQWREGSRVLRVKTKERGGSLEYLTHLYVTCCADSCCGVDHSLTS